MAPEQIRGESIDQRTDVYALGVLIYHMLTGRYPFRADTRQEIERMNLEAPPPRPSQSVGVPPSIDAVVLRCMDKRPERRYESARAVAQALRLAMDGSAAGADNVAQRQVVGVYVDVRPAHDQDEAEEQLLEEVADTLEVAEHTLRLAGFVIPLNTGTTLLAVRVLAEDPETAREQRKRAIERTVVLAQELAARETGEPTLRVDICLHVDTAVVRGSAGAPEISGPIVDVSAWPRGTLWKGVLATAASTADVDLDLTATVVT
jgi:serine/threonine-protein kinase